MHILPLSLSTHLQLNRWEKTTVRVVMGTEAQVKIRIFASIAICLCRGSANCAYKLRTESGFIYYFMLQFHRLLSGKQNLEMSSLYPCTNVTVFAVNRRTDEWLASFSYF